MTTFTADPLRVPRGLRNGLMLSAVLWAGLLGAAFAEEPQCDTRENFVAGLASSYGETPVAAGIDRKNSVITEMFAGPSGTWTIIVTGADGISCIVSFGTDFRRAAVGASA